MGMLLKPRVLLVNDQELENKELLLDVKRFLRNVAYPRRRFVDWLFGRLHYVDVVVTDHEGNTVTTEHLSEIERDHFDLWLRDWLRSHHPEPRIRSESRERIRLLITLLRMIFVKESQMWGRPLPQLSLLARDEN